MAELVATLVERWVEASGRSWSEVEEALSWLAPYGSDWRGARARCARADQLLLIDAVFDNLPNCRVDAALTLIAETISSTPSIVPWPRTAITRARHWRQRAVSLTKEDDLASQAIFQTLYLQQEEPPISELERQTLSDDLVRASLAALETDTTKTVRSSIDLACDAIVAAHYHHPILLEQYERYRQGAHRRSLAHAVTAAAHGLSAAVSAHRRIRTQPSLRRVGGTHDLWRQVDVSTLHALTFDLYHALQHAVSVSARQLSASHTAWTQGTQAFARALRHGALASITGAPTVQVEEPGKARKAALAQAAREQEKHQHAKFAARLRSETSHRCGTDCRNHAEGSARARFDPHARSRPN